MVEIQEERQLIADLKNKLSGLRAEDALIKLVDVYGHGLIFSTSFGWEDQVITHMIFENDLPIKVFTLDTGRMFSETYYVWGRTLDRYGKEISAYYPNADAVQAMVSQKGPSSFYESVENRKECCGIRKVEPLNRALSGQQCWITGIRAEQSSNRQDMEDVEWDAAHQLVKYHPLFSWSLQEVKDYVKQYHIPYNPLHDKGFPSIGCQPCTRAVAAGEDFRAGRWWWEDQSKKECGLHAG